MDSLELAEPIRHWVNDILVWVGFGTLVGLLAKAIMPGRDPGGAVVTLLMGIGGAVIGCGTLTFFMEHRITPISLPGFLVATGGAFIILLFYRLLGGHWFMEGESPIRRRRGVPRTARAPRRKRELVSEYED